jgi:O-antigen ligase
MWKSGLYSVDENLFLGSGYVLAKSIEHFAPESRGEEKAVDILKARFGSFHNTWVDALVSQGLIGLCVLLSFFIMSLRLARENGNLLLFGPLIAVGLNGLTESTLYMSILTGHLVLAGAIFLNLNTEN